MVYKFYNWYLSGVKKFQATSTKQDLGTSRGSFSKFPMRTHVLFISEYPLPGGCPCLFNHVAMGQVWFLLCTGYLLIFLLLCVTRPKLPLGQMSNHTTYDVYSLKAVMENVTDIVFFIVRKIYFYQALDSKAILNTLTNSLHQPWNSLTL